MRIEIGAEGRNFHIPIPRWLMGNAFVMNLVLTKYAGDLGGMSPQGVSRLCKELAAFGKNYPGWVLVDVESADGETVKIIL